MHETCGADGRHWALVVVDGPVGGDRRVQDMLRDLGQAGYRTQVVNVLDSLDVLVLGSPDSRSRPRGWRLLCALRSARDILALTLQALAKLRRFRRFWLAQDIAAYRLAPCAASWGEARRMAGAIFAGHALALRLAEKPGLVVANDLQAGAFSRALLGRDAATRLYYDAHEMSPFRHRAQNSVARAAVDLAVEAWVAGGAWRMACVSQALCAASQALYRPASVEYVANAYYPDSGGPAASIDASLPLHLVYFGAPAEGRGLGLLAKIAAIDANIRVWLFIPAHLRGEALLAPLLRLGSVTICRSPDYQPELNRLKSAQATLLSWCIIEDRCLSYRLAEPSKFHQSRAAGLPVIVAGGQYLASLVADEGNGIVIPAAQLQDAPAALAMIRQALASEAERIGAAARRLRANRASLPGWTWPRERDGLS